MMLTISGEVIIATMYLFLIANSLVRRPSDSWLSFINALEFYQEILDQANIFFVASTLPLIATFFTIKFVFFHIYFFNTNALLKHNVRNLFIHLQNFLPFILLKLVSVSLVTVLLLCSVVVYGSLLVLPLIISWQQDQRFLYKDNFAHIEKWIQCILMICSFPSLFGIVYGAAYINVPKDKVVSAAVAVAVAAELPSSRGEEEQQAPPTQEMSDEIVNNRESFMLQEEMEDDEEGKFLPKTELSRQRVMVNELQVTQRISYVCVST